MDRQRSDVVVTQVSLGGHGSFVSFAAGPRACRPIREPPARRSGGGVTTVGATLFTHRFQEELGKSLS